MLPAAWRRVGTSLQIWSSLVPTLAERGRSGTAGRHLCTCRLLSQTPVVFFFYYQQCSFQFPLHVKLFLSAQKVERVVDVWLALGVGSVANLVTKWSCAIANLLLSMLFAIIKLIISKPHIALLVISKSFATIFLSFCLFFFFVGKGVWGVWKIMVVGGTVFSLLSQFFFYMIVSIYIEIYAYLNCEHLIFSYCSS